jgi:hypothetical protein
MNKTIARPASHSLGQSGRSQHPAKKKPIMKQADMK